MAEPPTTANIHLAVSGKQGDPRFGRWQIKVTQLMAKNSKEAPAPFLGRFVPLSVLWEGGNPAFPSEQSARWALRELRGPLAAAGALAVHRGRTMVDPQKVSEVARQLAVEKARKRYA